MPAAAVVGIHAVGPGARSSVSRADRRGEPYDRAPRKSTVEPPASKWQRGHTTHSRALTSQMQVSFLRDGRRAAKEHRRGLTRHAGLTRAVRARAEGGRDPTVRWSRGPPGCDASVSRLPVVGTRARVPTRLRITPISSPSASQYGQASQTADRRSRSHPGRGLALTSPQDVAAARRLDAVEAEEAHQRHRLSEGRRRRQGDVHRRCDGRDPR